MLTLAASGDLTAEMVTRLFLALALLLGAARLFGELARGLGQPSVIGEILAGLILGPTILGQVWPDAYLWLYPDPSGGGAPPDAVIMKGFILLSACFLLLAAGLEVDLSSVWRQGTATLWVALVGMAVPFVLGGLAAWVWPTVMNMGDGGGSEAPLRLPFAIFVGIVVAITALPVIAKILMDLNLLKSDMGMLIMSAAMLVDIIGWVGFAVVKALMTGGGPEQTAMLLGLTVLFLAVMLTIGRVGCHRLVPYIQTHWSWPAGVIAFVLIVSLLCAAATEWIGIHSIFGAFIAGVAIGDSHHLRERTRETIMQFITSIFAPVFFASIALRINFFNAFDPLLVGVVLLIALVGKVGGTYLGARLAKLPGDQSWAVGFGMAAQGSMGVILGELAFDAGIIGSRMLVAIIVTAVVTSIVSGPAIKMMLKLKGQKRLGDYLSEKQFVANLSAGSVRDAIRQLSERAAAVGSLDADEVDAAVWRREQIVHTGLEHGLAVPHARLRGLGDPIVVLGRSVEGVDFDAADGRPAHLVWLILTDEEDHATQLDLLSRIARIFVQPDVRDRVMQAQTFIELRAAVSLADPESAATGHHDQSTLGAS